MYLNEKLSVDEFQRAGNMFALVRSNIVVKKKNNDINGTMHRDFFSGACAQLCVVVVDITRKVGVSYLRCYVDLLQGDLPRQARQVGTLRRS